MYLNFNLTFVYMIYADLMVSGGLCGVYELVKAQ